MNLSCGIDVGGTKIAGGVVDMDGNVLEQLRVESPARDVERIEDAISASAVPEPATLILIVLAAGMSQTAPTDSVSPKTHLRVTHINNRPFFGNSATGNVCS